MERAARRGLARPARHVRSPGVNARVGAWQLLATLLTCGELIRLVCLAPGGRCARGCDRRARAREETVAAGRARVLGERGNGGGRAQGACCSWHACMRLPGTTAWCHKHLAWRTTSAKPRGCGAGSSSKALCAPVAPESCGGVRPSDLCALLLRQIIVQPSDYKLGRLASSVDNYFRITGTRTLTRTTTTLAGGAKLPFKRMLVLARSRRATRESTPPLAARLARQRGLGQRCAPS